jgi:hypothetical protein
MNNVKNANPIFYKWCDTSLKFPLPLPAIIFHIRRLAAIMRTIRTQICAVVLVSK